MDHNTFQSNIAKIAGQRNTFLLFSLLQACAVILLTILLCMKKERILIVPTSGASFWIEENRASSGYIEKMGVFLSDLLLNRSPADVEKRNAIILQYVHPKSYHEIRKLLLQEQESILRGNQSFYFVLDRSEAREKECTFIAEGEFLAIIGKNGKESSISQKSKKRYTLRFSCEQGKLLLTSLKKEEA